MNTFTDIFICPEKLFIRNYKSIEDIKNECIFILDTNILLLPYTMGDRELNEIERIYTDLLSEQRLLIPAQVAKEFGKNRPKKLEEIYQSLSNFSSRIGNINLPQYPMLKHLEEHKDIEKIQSRINELIKDYKNDLNRLMQYVKNINWNDSVSQLYSRLFKEEYIIDYKWNYKELKDELEQRNKFNIPPAFKDKSKEDGGVGDFIIWKDILKIGSEKKSNLIFVTGDEKQDWFHRSMNTKLYPRFELMQEYKELSGGMDFYIISLSELIALFTKQDKEDIVESIRYVENRKSSSMRVRKEAIIKSNYKCEMCGKDSSIDGDISTSFLEIHHIRPLSQGGADTIDNISVLCPNCHRIVHERLRKESEFLGGSPCQMSGQICPGCKIGIMDVSPLGEGVECSVCRLFIPA